MSKILNQLEKLAMVIMPNMLHPAWNDPNHPKYEANHNWLKTVGGSVLGATGLASLASAGKASSYDDALKGLEAAGKTGSKAKLSALLKSKYGRIGAGVLGIGGGTLGLLTGLKGSDNKKQHMLGSADK
jgi:hypothetical protein